MCNNNGLALPNGLIFLMRKAFVIVSGLLLGMCSAGRESQTGGEVSGWMMSEMGKGFLLSLGQEWEVFLEGVALDANEFLYLVGTTIISGERGIDIRMIGDSLDSHTFSDSPPRDIYVAKVSPDGHLIWDRIIGGPKDEWGYSVAVDGKGGVYVVGSTSSYGAGKDDVFVVKLDTSGRYVWARAVGGSDIDFATNAMMGPDGYLYLAGTTYSFGPQKDNDFPEDLASSMYVLKLSTEGRLAWDRAIGTPWRDYAHGIAFDREGNLIIGASSTYNFEYNPYLFERIDGPCLLKMSPEGKLHWIRWYLGVDDIVGLNTSVAVDDNDHIVLAGNVMAVFYPWTHLIRTNPMGNAIWCRQGVLLGEAGMSVGYPVAVAIDDDGTILVAGDKLGGLSGTSYVMQVDSSDGCLIKYWHLVCNNWVRMADMQIVPGKAIVLVGNYGGTGYVMRLEKDFENFQACDVCSLDIGGPEKQILRARTFFDEAGDDSAESEYNIRKRQCATRDSAMGPHFILSHVVDDPPPLPVVGIIDAKGKVTVPSPVVAVPRLSTRIYH